MDRQAWLQGLKVGDWVVTGHQTAGDRDGKCIIVKETKAWWFVQREGREWYTMRFRKSDGKEVGGGRPALYLWPAN